MTKLAANRAHLTPVVVPVKRNGKTVRGTQYFAIGDDPEIELTFDEQSSSVGATFETEASRRGREALLRKKLHDAEIQTNTDVWDLVAERTKNGGRYTDAEIEQIMAAEPLTDGMGELQRNVRVASLAETVSERYPAAAFIGYKTVCHDEPSSNPTWTRQAMILDDNQTVLAVIDEQATDEDSRDALLWALPEQNNGYREIDPCAAARTRWCRELSKMRGDRS